MWGGPPKEVRRFRDRTGQKVMLGSPNNQACRYATHLIALRGGRVVAEGAPGYMGLCAGWAVTVDRAVAP
jgi:hypothetical protein